MRKGLTVILTALVIALASCAPQLQEVKEIATDVTNTYLCDEGSLTEVPEGLVLQLTDAKEIYVNVFGEGISTSEMELVTQNGQLELYELVIETLDGERTIRLEATSYVAVVSFVRGNDVKGCVAEGSS